MKTQARPKIDPPKPGCKIDRLVTALTNEGGSVRALSTELGWLPHTTRAALTRLKQRGYQIKRSLVEGAKESIYRIETKSTRRASSR
jgi:lambda repressor-like predicted transcriptional regulator